MITLAIIIGAGLWLWFWVTRVPEGYEIKFELEPIRSYSHSTSDREIQVRVYRNGQFVGCPFSPMPGLKYIAGARLARRHAKYGGG